MIPLFRLKEIICEEENKRNRFFHISKKIVIDKITPEHLSLDSRLAEIIETRQLFYYFAYKVLEVPQKIIIEDVNYVGDRTCISYAVKQIGKLIGIDRRLKDIYDSIQERIDEYHLIEARFDEYKNSPDLITRKRVLDKAFKIRFYGIKK